MENTLRVLFYCFFLHCEQVHVLWWWFCSNTALCGIPSESSSIYILLTKINQLSEYKYVEVYVVYLKTHVFFSQLRIKLTSLGAFFKYLMGNH